MTNDNCNLHSSQFGEDFKWGVSTAAFQIEGSCSADGKGASIWDEFTGRKGAITDGHHGRIACDNYIRYREDIALIKEMGISCYRFSIAWTRILPEGTGAINQAGIDHYNNVINCCIENGIEPWITLYHWDLPQALELKGGWTNRESIQWFKAYSGVCISNFGDRVQHWMLMNEPMVFTGAGYFLGIHAPGRRGLKNFLPAVHHSILAIAEASHAIRKLNKNIQIGTTFSCSLIEPFNLKPANVAAAKRVDALANRLFVEPLTGYGYPFDDLKFLRKIRKYMCDGDEEKMIADLDFIGIQNYTREVVKRSLFTPYLMAKQVPARIREVPVTAMGWEVYPPAIYKMLQQFSRYLPAGKLYITENGSAYPDTVTDGKVNDYKRTGFLKANLGQVLKAKNKGVKVDGYFVWTLTDNFEWKEGYHPRFGLVHVDFETQRRIIKDSGYWYKSFLSRK